MMWRECGFSCCAMPSRFQTPTKEAASLPEEEGDKLTERGHEQARNAASALAGRDITRLIVSPMRRAQETAAPISEALGLEIETDTDIYELREEEGYDRLRPEEQKLKRWSEWMVEHAEDPAYAPPGADSFEGMRERTRALRTRLESEEGSPAGHHPRHLPALSRDRHPAGRPLRPCGCGSPVATADRELRPLSLRLPSAAASGRPRDRRLAVRDVDGAAGRLTRRRATRRLPRRGGERSGLRPRRRHLAPQPFSNGPSSWRRRRPR